MFSTEAHGSYRVPNKPLSLVTWMAGYHPLGHSHKLRSTWLLHQLYLPTSEPSRQTGRAAQTHPHMLRPNSRRYIKKKQQPTSHPDNKSENNFLFNAALFGSKRELKGKSSRTGRGRVARKQVPLCPGWTTGASISSFLFLQCTWSRLQQGMLGWYAAFYSDAVFEFGLFKAELFLRVSCH